MPKLTRSNPSYRKHRASGQAIVTFGRHDFYLGPWKSKASKAEYDRVIGEWLANGRRLPAPSGGPADLIVCEMIEAFWEQHVQPYYRRPDGSPTQERSLFKDALAPLNRLYGATAAHDFGPRSLEAVRNTMIEKDWCRTTVNNAIGRIRAMFRWAVAKELIPVSVLQGLMAVTGLRAGRSEARDSEPVKPVSDQLVTETLPLLSRTVAAMVQVQLLTGARPGEICQLRTGELDMTTGVWRYTPATHKSQWRGKPRTIFLGPRAQQILKPFLKLDPAAFCFSPADAERERRDELHARRKTPLHYGNCPGTNVKRRPQCTPGGRYTVDSYRAAIKRACELAFQPAPPLGKLEGESVRAWKARLTPEQIVELKAWNVAHSWHPHQLRHSRGTQVRASYGVESAGAVLGHSNLSTTEIYAERNEEMAREIAAKIG